MDSTLLKLVSVLLAAAVYGGQPNWECTGPPCKCHWVSGKKTATCTNQNLTRIPDNLSQEIQHLEFTGNKLRNLSRDAFHSVGLDNLHKLVLRECDIETVDSKAFNGLKLVIEIDLSLNRIKILYPGTFHETQRLRVLLLNGNLIERLEDGLFHNLIYLQKIEISNNNLEYVSSRTFYNLTGLQFLAFDGNNLSNLRRETFEDLPKLGSISLKDNPWNCDCNLKDFRDWTILKNVYTRPTDCELPTNLTRKMWGDVQSDHFACRPQIMYIGPSAKLEVGAGDVTLSCNVSGTPLPQVTWMHRARILNNGTRRYNGEPKSYVIVSNGHWVNLTIPNATPADKGEYICQAKSPGGLEERNVSLNVLGDAVGTNDSEVSLALALGLGLTALLLLILLTLVLCACYCRRRRSRRDEKTSEVNALEHHGLGEQEKSLITAINPVVKPPRRYEAAPSVTSHGTETTELNRTLLDNDSVFAGGVGDDDRERSTPELEGGTLPRGTTYRPYPPDLLAFSGGRGASPTSQASTAPDSSRLPSQPATFSPTNSTNSVTQYPTNFKTLPHNRSGAPYSAGPPVMPRHGYVTIPRRPRAPSWSSAPPTSPDGLEPVYDNLGLRTTADGSSVLSLNKSPEPSGMRGRPLPGTPTSHYHPAIQRSTPNILATSPTDRAAPEGAPEWPSKLSDEMNVPFLGGTLGRKVPPRPPPKPKKKSANGPLYEDEGEDGTEV